MSATLASTKLSRATRVQRVFSRECVAFFAEVVQAFGVPKSVGQIYGLLFASPVPLGFPEIVAYLQISKGSASQGLQLLRSLGAIVAVDSGASHLSDGRVSEASARTVRYEPELSLRQLITGVLRERITPLAGTSTNTIKRLQELAEQIPVNTEFYLGRSKQLEIWRRQFKTALPLLTFLLSSRKHRRD